jgi:glyoxylase-like metal-dependent hydrolase (beta-lactamase superfamily II)
MRAAGALRAAAGRAVRAQVPSNARSVRYIAREHRRWNQGQAEWWAERTFRFGRGGSEPQALLSYEIVTPFQMNQYLLGCARTGKAAIIDTGCATASLATAKAHGLTIEYLLQTHAHIDHIAGLAEIKQETLPDAPIYLHPEDLPWCRSPAAEAPRPCVSRARTSVCS